MVEGKKVNLWPVEVADLPRNFKWANDPELRFMAGFTPFPYSSMDVDEWFKRIHSDPSGKVFTIRTKEGQQIGNVEITGIDWRNGKGELGLIIGEKEFWGEEYGLDAVTALLGFCFQELHLHRISASILSHNERAVRCFEKSGFSREGLQREAFFARGRYWDVIQMGILEREFEKRND